MVPGRRTFEVLLAGSVIRRSPESARFLVSRYDGAVRRTLLLILLSGCALTSDQKALAIERGLDAGSAGLDLAVDANIEICQAKGLPTEEARGACVDTISKINDETTPLIETAALALQSYWIAAAAGDKPAAQKALLALRHAVENLPDKYFAGLKSLAQSIR